MRCQISCLYSDVQVPLISYDLAETLMNHQMTLEKFPPLLRLANHYETIASECAAIDRSHLLTDFNRGYLDHEDVAVFIQKAYEETGNVPWVQAWGEYPDKWLNYGLIMHDQAPLGSAGVPKTIEILSHLRGVKVAALSLFKPGLVLPIHSHPELADEGMFTFHMGLEAADEGNYLFTDGFFIREERGKSFVFDGSKTHFAFNASESDRLILYIEFSVERLDWVD
jgi:Aspartyl/Asparaginyl beta-hydroxylase